MKFCLVALFAFAVDTSSVSSLLQTCKENSQKFESKEAWLESLGVQLPSNFKIKSSRHGKKGSMELPLNNYYSITLVWINGDQKEFDDHVVLEEKIQQTCFKFMTLDGFMSNKRLYLLYKKPLFLRPLTIKQLSKLNFGDKLFFYLYLGGIFSELEEMKVHYSSLEPRHVLTADDYQNGAVIFNPSKMASFPGYIELPKQKISSPDASRGSSVGEPSSSLPFNLQFLDYSLNSFWYLKMIMNYEQECAQKKGYNHVSMIPASFPEGKLWDYLQANIIKSPQERPTIDDIRADIARMIEQNLSQ